MSQQITKLLQKLSKNNIDYFLIPNSDQFFNEYLPDSEKRIEFLTNFDGSNAFIILNAKQSYFFTDSRYLIAAKQQIDTKIFKIIDIAIQNPSNFLINNAQNKIIAFDPFLHSVKFIKNLIQHNLNLTIISENPIDQIWQNRTITSKEIFLHQNKFTGEDHKTKINKICDNLDKNCDAIFVSSAESCSYLFNLRSFIIDYIPTCPSFAIITKNAKILLFLDKDNLTIGAKESLRDVQLENFKDFSWKMRVFLEENQIETIQTDLNYCNYQIFTLFEKQNIHIIDKIDPALLARSIKNTIEIDGMKKAHKKDAIAVIKFLYWLENYNDKNQISEISAAEKLLEFRKQDPDFICPSFNTISGFAENGAIIHYKVTEKTNKYFNKDSIYLVDSGGQYQYGTTDITRSIAIGKASKEQKKHFTLVLKGHIALATAKFPIATRGDQLDILARQYLWQEGKNYGHGTGHGVGYFLNVHEGPCSISSGNNKFSLKAGMILSNEPGFYLENNYGMRIENLILVKESEQKGFLEFETITLVPIDYNLIDFKLLNDDEKEWLENYHQKIYNEFKDKIDNKYLDFIPTIFKT